MCTTARDGVPASRPAARFARKRPCHRSPSPAPRAAVMHAASLRPPIAQRTPDRRDESALPVHRESTVVHPRPRDAPTRTARVTHAPRLLITARPNACAAATGPPRPMRGACPPPAPCDRGAGTARACTSRTGRAARVGRDLGMRVRGRKGCLLASHARTRRRSGAIERYRSGLHRRLRALHRRRRAAQRHHPDRHAPSGARCIAIGPRSIADAARCVAPRPPMHRASGARRGHGRAMRRAARMGRGAHGAGAFALRARCIGAATQCMAAATKRHRLAMRSTAVATQSTAGPARSTAAAPASTAAGPRDGVRVRGVWRRGAARGPQACSDAARAASARCYPPARGARPTSVAAGRVIRTPPVSSTATALRSNACTARQ